MIYLIQPEDPVDAFPDPARAERDPNGLLAIGGDLTPARLLSAYRRGIFPWYNHDQPILWWSPDPRLVLLPEALHVARSLRKRLRRGDYQLSLNQAFGAVIRGCAGDRADADGTWLSEAMIQAYVRLHQAGYAHSVEVWSGSELVGGLYGVRLGPVFFGESMFSHRSDASKCAMVLLCQLAREEQIQLIDCQVYTDHLASLGACEISRDAFTQRLDELLTDVPPAPCRGWQLQSLDSQPLASGI